MAAPVKTRSAWFLRNLRAMPSDHVVVTAGSRCGLLQCPSVHIWPVRSNDATGLVELTLRKCKVTAQVAEHRSCWTAICAAENLNTKRKVCVYKRDQHTRSSTGPGVASSRIQLVQSRKSSQGEEKGPAMLHAPGPILFVTADLD